MRAALRWAREMRVSRRQLWVATVVSGAVSTLIVVTAFGQTGLGTAALEALRGAATPGPSGSATGSSGGSATGSSGGSLGSLPSASGAGSLPTGAPLPSSGPAASANGGGAGSGGSSGPPAGSGSTKSPGSKKSGSGSGGKAKTKPKPTSPVKHIFVISLATGSYADAFGPSSPATYMNRTLRPQGDLLSRYQTLSGVPLTDELALIGGQPANSETLANCPNYDEFPAGRAPNRRGVMSGSGCVYPNTVLTLGDQMDGARLRWRGFIDGMSAPCVHPNSTASDSADSAGYDPRGNPFVFFHSLLDLGDCQHYDLPLTQLAGSLTGPAHRVPSFVYISADPCDGGAAGCSSPGTGTTTTPTTPTSTTTTSTTTTPTSTDPTVTAADAFLRRVVPGILHSRAYRTSGALFILFSGTSRAQAGTPTGGLVLSRFVRGGSTYRRAANVYGVLRTVENAFGLTPLALARRVKPLHLFRTPHRG